MGQGPKPPTLHLGQQAVARADGHADCIKAPAMHHNPPRPHPTIRYWMMKYTSIAPSP